MQEEAKNKIFFVCVFEVLVVLLLRPSNSHLKSLQPERAKAYSVKAQQKNGEKKSLHKLRNLINLSYSTMTQFLIEY